MKQEPHNNYDSAWLLYVVNHAPQDLLDKLWDKYNTNNTVTRLRLHLMDWQVPECVHCPEGFSVAEAVAEWIKKGRQY